MSCSPRNKERPRTPGADELGVETHSGWLKKSDATMLGSFNAQRRYSVLHKASDMRGMEPTILYFDDQMKTKPRGYSILTSSTESKLVDETLTLTLSASTLKFKAARRVHCNGI